VTLTNTPVFQSGFSTTNTLWARLVQSGQPWLVPPDDSLRGHTANMFAALATMHLSAIAVSMYLAYISQWVQQRAWLAAKAAAHLRTWPRASHGGNDSTNNHTGAGGGVHAGRTQPATAAAAAAAADRVVPADIHTDECPMACVSGVLLSPQQLLDLCRSHVSLLLLDGRGLLGRAAMVCFHAGIVNTILLLSWLLSHVLVLRVAPHVLPRLLVALYYPPAPGVGGDVCGLENAQQFSGLVGRFVLFIGGHH
jgi:hypothetical protein